MILRNLSKCMLPTFSNSNLHLFDGIKSDVSGMENISKLPFYESFKLGLNLSLQNKLQQANKHYQASLNLLQENQDHLKDHYMHIYKKLIINNISLKKPKLVEENIYALIKIKKKYQVQSVLLYDDYVSLFQVFLTFNPEKAILLGKALLSEKESQNLTMKHKKIFQFNLANAYFLIGNYQDAKAKYSQCLQSQPSSQLKIKIYNNLAVSCWWNKNPLFAEKAFQPTRHKVSLIDSDYKQVKSLLLKGMEISQDIESISNEQIKYKLKQAILQYEFDLDAQFQREQTSLLIYNLAQYYIHNEPTERVKILYWLRALLKLSQKHHPALFDQINTTLCLLNNEKDSLLQFVPEMLQKYKGKVEEIYYTKIAAFLKRSQGKNDDSYKISKKGAQLEEKFRSEDEYIFKRKFLKIFAFKI